MSNPVNEFKSASSQRITTPSPACPPSNAQKRIQNITAQKANNTTARFAADKARCVLQAEAGVTNAKGKWPIIGSFGADPCVILAIQDTGNKVAAIAHIDAGTDTVQAVGKLTESITEASKSIQAQRAEKRIAQEQAKDRATPRYQKLIRRLANSFRPRTQRNVKAQQLQPEPMLIAHMTSASPLGNDTLRKVKANVKAEPRLQLGRIADQSGMAIDSRTGELHLGDFRQKDFGKSSSLLGNIILTVARLASNQLQPIDMRFINDENP